MRRILIAGIGNIFDGDDAFGVAVVSELAASPMPANVRVMEYGIRGIDLVFALLDGYDFTILVDAHARGSAPGTLCAMEPDLANEPAAGRTLIESAHALDPLRALHAAKKAGARLGRVLLVGCEPATLAGGIGLSPQVRAAVAPAAEMIRALVHEANERWRAEGMGEAYAR